MAADQIADMRSAFSPTTPENGLDQSAHFKADPAPSAATALPSAPEARIGVFRARSCAPDELFGLQAGFPAQIRQSRNRSPLAERTREQIEIVRDLFRGRGDFTQRGRA